MATETPSYPTPAHPVFSDLLDLLNTIPPPDCNKCHGDTPVSLCSCDNCKDTGQLHKLMGNVKYIQDSLQRLSTFEQNLGHRLGPLKSQVKRPGFLSEPRFKDLTNAVMQLKFKLPYTAYDELVERDDTPVPSQEDSSPDAGDGDGDSDQLGRNYEALNIKEKKCLWCFSVFPANVEVKKRVLINWWIGNGLLQDPAVSGVVKSGEERGEGMLKTLEEKGFIEQVVKKKRKSNRWRMASSVRSFLLKSKEEDGQDFENLILLQNSNLDLDKSMSNEVKTVFNVDKTVITESEAGLLAAMRNLVVLHLGISHVRGLELITRSLKKKKQLSLLSLAGILSLRELPNCVCRLKTLKVLDLKACQALQRLPSEIGRIKSLTHLDVSGCHILCEMPKALASLLGLEVLKGFVIGPVTTQAGCSLEDLRSLQSLRNLSLSVLRTNFPDPNDLDDLAHINGLVRLKILWKPVRPEPETIMPPAGPSSSKPPRSPFVCCLVRDQAVGEEEPATLAHVMFKLEKLDLWFPPKDREPFLLVPSNFPTLKKLYIRGAEFHHLSYSNAEMWEKVEILRLISLPQLLKIDWDELMKKFPQLSYLELQNCPNLQFSQYCDDQGVWTRKN